MNDTEKIVADESVSIDSPKTVETIVPTATVAPQQPSSAKKQASTVKGFNFTREYVRLYFTSKDSCILDKKSPESIRLARELKGCDVEYLIVGVVTTEFGTYNKVSIICIS